jgi:hypothetical protein
MNLTATIRRSFYFQLARAADVNTRDLILEIQKGQIIFLKGFRLP